MFHLGRWIASECRERLGTVTQIALRGHTRIRREMPARLAAFVRDFTERFGRADQEFLELGRALRSLHADARSLAELVNGRLQFAHDALQHSRIAGESGLAAAALTHLRSALNETARELGMLQSITSDLRRLVTHLEGVGRIGTFVHASVFGFAVESARTPECLQMFGPFVEELRGLAGKVAAVVDTLGIQAETSRADEEKEWRQLSANHARLCQLTAQIESASAATAAEAQSLIEQAITGLEQAARHTGKISRHADEAVYHLQFGDIIRQKTEHISAALEQAAGQLQRASGREYRASAAAADRVIAVQVGQLELIRSEIHRVHERLAESFQCLTKETVALKDILQPNRHSNQAHPGSDPLDAFRADFRSLEQLQHEGTELRRQTRLRAESAARSAITLSHRVNEVKTINTDMHLRALNAIIKTAALGSQGSTLSVLSMHLDALSRNSSGLVSDVVRILNGISTRAQSCEAPAHEDLNAGLREGMERIESAYGAWTESSGNATRLAEQQRQTLDGAGLLLNLLKNHTVAIDRQIAELKAFREILGPWASQKSAQPEAPNDDSLALAQNYTMQSERDVHLRASSNPAEIQTQPVNAQDEPFLLFDSPSQAPRDGGSSIPERPDKVPAGPPVEEFGENVELF